MKISIREALFSGEEVDDWEPPKSDWIVAADLKNKDVGPPNSSQLKN